MEPKAFDRMRDLVLVSAGTNLAVAVATLVLVAVVDVPGDGDNFLYGAATLGVVLAVVLPLSWRSFRKLKNRASLPEGARVRGRSEILAGSVKGLLLWIAVALGATALWLGTFAAGMVAAGALLGPLFLVPIRLTERHHACEIFIAAERSSDRSQAATRYWTRPTA
jgi:hypothetical protein